MLILKNLLKNVDASNSVCEHCNPNNSWYKVFIRGICCRRKFYKLFPLKFDMFIEKHLYSFLLDYEFWKFDLLAKFLKIKYYSVTKKHNIALLCDINKIINILPNLS